MEAASTRPDAGETGGAPAPKKVKKRRPKKTHPTPDRQPSSESYYSSEGEQDGEKEGEEGQESAEATVSLHEDVHEELYGLPTPKKSTTIVSIESSEITPTELEQTPGDDSSCSEIDEKDGSGNATTATGTHKDCILVIHSLTRACICMIQH